MPTYTPGKYLVLPTSGEDPINVSAAVVSTGSTSAGQIVALGANGKLDPSLIDGSQYGAPDIIVGTAFEGVTAGDYVNVFINSGVNSVRRANASAFATRAMGFVRDTVAKDGMVTVYKSGAQNVQVVNLTPGQQWLSDTQPGKAVATPPTTSGSVVQKIGYASSPTTLHTKIEPAFGLG